MDAIITGKSTEYSRGFLMKTRRIESALPETTYQLVKNAAELSGLTLRSFISEAVVSFALERTEQLGKNQTFQLSVSEIEFLKKVLKNPEPYYQLSDEVLERAKASKLKELPVEPGDEL